MPLNPDGILHASTILWEWENNSHHERQWVSLAALFLWRVGAVFTWFNPTSLSLPGYLICIQFVRSSVFKWALGPETGDRGDKEFSFLLDIGFATTVLIITLTQFMSCELEIFCCLVERVVSMKLTASLTVKLSISLKPGHYLYSACTPPRPRYLFSAICHIYLELSQKRILSYLTIY